MRSAKAILLLITFFVLSSATNNLYANDTSFSLVLRSTQDTSYTDYQFMAVGWANQAHKIPAPPAPPGDNFYVYIDGYFFKEIRSISGNEMQTWDFNFTLSSREPVRNLFIDPSYIVEHTDYAVLVDGNGVIRHDLHNDTEINLDKTYNGKFSILALPKNAAAAPQILPSFNNKFQLKKIDVNSYTLDLKTVFTNTATITSYIVDTFGNTSIKYEVSDDALLTATINDKYKEIRLRIYALNEYGENFADVFLQPDILTDVEEDAIPTDVKLNQNYPNPFNPTTSISFDLNEATRVMLNIYNINGQLVATLINNNLQAGNHITEFNATKLPSGVYIYRLQTSSTVLTKKMTLLK
jgi:hypothetical protein